MANEAEIITLLGNQGDPIEYTIAAGSVIPIGSIMNINSTPQTATIGAADELIAGIAAKESKATDTFTKMPCITHAVVKLNSTSGCTLGYPAKLEGINLVTDADDDTVDQKGEVVAISMDTVGAAGSGSFLMNLG